LSSLSPKLIDVHAHLCDPVFDRDREEVLERARRAGVAAVVAVGENLADARKNLALARRHAMILPAAGLYPTILDVAEAEAMQDFIREHRAELVAVGEVGLDHWAVQEERDRGLQREIFRSFIALAAELDLPLNVHSRSAGRETIALLLECNARRVHLHAFDGRAGAALPAVEAGYFFSIPPSVVRSPQKQKLVRRLPLSAILVETDSPVLGMTAGERNEPARLPVVIEAIARLKNVSEDEVIAAAVANTGRLYGLPM
jgi:TatD DNase family protein